MLKHRIKALEHQAQESAEIKRLFILPDEPTPEHMAELARRGLVAFILPDNGRTITRDPNSEP